MHVVGQPKVTQHDGTATNRAVRANRRAAGHASAACHGAVFSDAYVVADLHQIVELDAVFQHRVLQCATVNAGIGPDLDVVANQHRAELFDFDPAAAVRCKTETVRTNYRTGVDDAALANAAIVADRDMGRKPAARPNACIRANGAMRGNLHPLTHHSAGADADKRTNRHVCADAGGRVDERAGMNGWRSIRRMQPFPELRDQCKAIVRIVHHNTRAALEGGIADRARNDHAACCRLRKLVEIFWIAEKRQIVRTGRFQGGQLFDQQLRAAHQFSRHLIGKKPGDINKFERHVVPAFFTLMHARTTKNYFVAFSALITLSVMSCLGLT